MSLGKKKMLSQGAAGDVAGNNFNTVLYNGNSSTQAISTVGFQPDFTWIKRTDGTENHYLQDSVRGSTQQIYSNLNNEQFNETTAVTSFISSGFNIGSYNGINNSGEDYVAWNWKAGGTAVSNTDGTIASQVSANTAAGFSIVNYTGTGNLATVGHGLGKPVELILSKRLDSGSWAVYSAPTGINKFLELDASDMGTSFSNYWGAAVPTNDVFGVVDNNFNNNATGKSIIAYCFTSIEGYSKIGSYTGNGSGVGPTTTIGFTPSFLMIKRYSGSGSGYNWIIFDNKRDTSNPRYQTLAANTDAAQGGVNSDNYPRVNFNATAFQIAGSDGQVNRNNEAYLYMAIA